MFQCFFAVGGLLNAVTAYTHHGMDSWKRGSNCRAWLLTLYPSHVPQILCQESITTRTGSQVSSDESETCVEVEGNPMSLALFARIVEHVCWHVANKPVFFGPKPQRGFIQGSQHTTWNPKVKIQNLPNPRSNSTYKRQFPKVRKQSSPTSIFLVLRMLAANKKDLLVVLQAFC